MYNYGYVQTDNLIIDRTNGYKNRSLFYNFKNICAENYSYVKDNVILNKILGYPDSRVDIDNPFLADASSYLDFSEHHLYDMNNKF